MRLKAFIYMESSALIIQKYFRISALFSNFDTSLPTYPPTMFDVTCLVILLTPFLFNIAFSQYYDKQASVVSNTNGKVTLLHKKGVFLL